MFTWTYSGVNSSIPGNGGPECAAFLSPTKKFIESVILLTCGAVLVSWGFKNMSYPQRVKNNQDDRCGKRILLVLITLVWGIEIGFKLASESVIYILNPCHITTAIQIYLLAAPPSPAVTCMFRIHFNFLNGAILAILFPVTAARVLPFETTTYWIQHVMMLVVPYYLLRLGGVYNLEKLSDMSWWAFSYGSNIFYHFIILQGIAIPTQVNLNHMLCPTKRDPFYGPYYRMLGVTHQSLLSPLTNKFYSLMDHLYPSNVRESFDQGDADRVTEKIAGTLKGGGDVDEDASYGKLIKNGHPHKE